MNKRKVKQTLKLARQRIEQNWNFYVCLALDGVAEFNRDYLKEVEWIKAHIGMMLGECETLEDWLHANGHANLRDIRGENYDDLEAKAKATRLAWIDHMIEVWTS